MKTKKAIKQMKLKTLNRIALFTALLAVCAWISIPSPVPFTLQTFGIFLAAGLLEKTKGTISVLVYILLGAMGLPVFSGGRGGLGIILGETGGYIMGFLPATYVCGAMCEKNKKPLALFASMVLGLIVCYAAGSMWAYFMFFKVGYAGVITVLTKHVLSFIVPDLIKLAVATFVVKELNKRGI